MPHTRIPLLNGIQATSELSTYGTLISFTPPGLLTDHVTVSRSKQTGKKGTPCQFNPPNLIQKEIPKQESQSQTARKVNNHQKNNHHLQCNHHHQSSLHQQIHLSSLRKRLNNRPKNSSCCRHHHLVSKNQSS